MILMPFINKGVITDILVIFDIYVWKIRKSRQNLSKIPKIKVVRSRSD